MDQLTNIFDENEGLEKVGIVDGCRFMIREGNGRFQRGGLELDYRFLKPKLDSAKEVQEAIGKILKALDWDDDDDWEF